MEYLQYGLLNEKLIHISVVEKGLACNCVCPHCKSPLIARKGQKNAHHFAHYRLADCNHGTETALHMMAKNIVAKTKRVFVPYTPENIYGNSKGGGIVRFENAELEKRLSDTVRGDVLLRKGERSLNVEIKVTHEVDWEKTIEIFNLGVPTIEIDLSDIRESFTPELIERILLSGEHTELIFSPKSKDIFAKRILGEWKTVYYSGGRYVEDCPLSNDRAYFSMRMGRGGSSECHECEGFEEYLRGSPDGDKVLCRGVLGKLDYSQIDKILSLEKGKKHLRYVKLLMKDGSEYERRFG